MTGLHPIVVLEGPDMSGKTTLADTIVNRFGARRIHATYRFKDKMDLYHRAVFERALKMAKDTPVVIDRWWPSEVVYARAFRGRSPWPRNPRHFDRMGREVGAQYVFCLPANRDQYVEAWSEGRAKRYADKPWALKGRVEAEDNQAKVYDLYQQVLTWMDAGQRHDVSVYDRFGLEGRDEDNRAAWLSAFPMNVDENTAHWIESRLRRIHVLHAAGVKYARHKVWPGARWSAEQRDLDNMLTRLSLIHI